jgi:hypothetical protein
VSSANWPLRPVGGAGARSQVAVCVQSVARSSQAKLGLRNELMRRLFGRLHTVDKTFDAKFTRHRCQQVQTVLGDRLLIKILVTSEITDRTFKQRVYGSPHVSPRCNDSLTMVGFLSLSRFRYGE